VPPSLGKETPDLLNPLDRDIFCDWILLTLRYAPENRPSSRVVTENSYIKIENDHNTKKIKPGKSQQLKP
jgi:hypothetical protein